MNKMIVCWSGTVNWKATLTTSILLTYLHLLGLHFQLFYHPNDLGDNIFSLFITQMIWVTNCKFFHVHILSSIPRAEFINTSSGVHQYLKRSSIPRAEFINTSSGVHQYLKRSSIPRAEFINTSSGVQYLERSSSIPRATIFSAYLSPKWFRWQYFQFIYHPNDLGDKLYVFTPIGTALCGSSWIKWLFVEVALLTERPL